MALIDPKTKKAIWYEADHGEQRDPFRDWIRRRCRSGNEGFVCEDLDVVINCYGELIGRNHSDDGRIKLVEKKFNRDMKYAQKKTFELLDRLLKTGDPKARFYRGLYTVKLPLIKKIGKTKCEVCKGSGYIDMPMNDEDFNRITYVVREHPSGDPKLMSPEEFIRFLEDKDL